MEAYTREKLCVEAAMDKHLKTSLNMLILKKGRKYIYVEGDLYQASKETFKNIFGEIMHYSEGSDILTYYLNEGYELRGWINKHGCFKNN